MAWEARHDLVSATHLSRVLKSHPESFVPRVQPGRTYHISCSHSFVRVVPFTWDILPTPRSPTPDSNPPGPLLTWLVLQALLYAFRGAVFSSTAEHHLE